VLILYYFFFTLIYQPVSPNSWLYAPTPCVFINANGKEHALLTLLGGVIFPPIVFGDSVFFAVVELGILLICVIVKYIFFSVTIELFSNKKKESIKFFIPFIKINKS